MLKRIFNSFLTGALLLAGCSLPPAVTQAPIPSLSPSGASALPDGLNASPTTVQCTATLTPLLTYPGPVTQVPGPVLPGASLSPTLGLTVTPTLTPAACSAQMTAAIVPLAGTVNQSLLYYSFVDALHGWASTDSALLATEDGGQTWQVRTAVPQVQQWEPDQTFYRIDFISTLEGFGVDHGTIMVHTLDGGRTWQDLSDFVPTRSVYRLDFVDPQHGWIVTYPFGLLGSRDGGLSWLPLASPCTSHSDLEQLNVTFLDDQTGWATCNLSAGFGLMVNALYTTQDGGEHWYKLAEAPGDFPVNATPTPGLGWLPELDGDSAPSFSDRTHGWLTAGSGQLYATEDGGRSWQAVSQNNGTPYFSSPHRFDAASGLVLAGAGVGGKTGPALLKTVDGGQSWTQILPKYYPQFASYLNTRVGYGVDGYGGTLGTDQVYRTGDGGRTWNVIAALPAALFNPFQVQFVDALHGWVIGQDCPIPANQQDCDKEALYHTVNGGLTWERLWPRQSSEIIVDAMDFVSPLEGYLMGYLAGGSSRGLYFTQDGGQTLEAVQTVVEDGSMTTYSFLYGLQYQFLSARVGYGINHSSFSWTQDGARTWQPLPAACLGDGIPFTPGGAFSLGRDGSLWVVTTNISSTQDYSTGLISSVDGGKKWQALLLPGMVVTAIQFVDALHGWLKGGTQTRYQGGYLFGADHNFGTDDGGHTWMQLN